MEKTEIFIYIFNGLYIHTFVCERMCVNCRLNCQIKKKTREKDSQSVGQARDFVCMCKCMHDFAQKTRALEYTF